MTLAMSWDEWAAHDAVALAARVRQGDVTPAGEFRRGCELVGNLSLVAIDPHLTGADRTIEPTLNGWPTESSSSASREPADRRHSRFSRLTSTGRSWRRA